MMIGQNISEQGSLRKAARLVRRMERLYPDHTSWRGTLQAMRRAKRREARMCRVPDDALSNSAALFAGVR